mmetsp:Transcript_24472/g.36522  ORF Transcript_24472/g.36522 Transcript_24472/m.36522 type:complete len:664 (+) Transcript_24472:1-1992(+)
MPSSSSSSTSSSTAPSPPGLSPTMSADDADVAAGVISSPDSSPPKGSGCNNSTSTNKSFGNAHKNIIHAHAKAHAAHAHAHAHAQPSPMYSSPSPNPAELVNISLSSPLPSPSLSQPPQQQSDHRYHHHQSHHQTYYNQNNQNKQVQSQSQSQSQSQLQHRHNHHDYDQQQQHQNHQHHVNTPHQYNNINEHHLQQQQGKAIYSPSSLSISKRTTATATSMSTSDKKEILVLGIDISHLSRKYQFIACAMGVFSFSLLYGFLQELISVTLCNRQLGLFLAMMQFLGYTIWSRIFHLFVENKLTNRKRSKSIENDVLLVPTTTCTTTSIPPSLSPSSSSSSFDKKTVPFKLYLLLSILRAIDAGMTNMAMAYVNYPAKTLMKSSRVVFTMLFGTLIRRKKYKSIDYLVVVFMVSGLVIFMHADSKSSAVFQPLGIVMLMTSLLCDGAINNMSEAIMIQYDVGQDEFIYNLYSIAVCGIIAAAAVRGDLKDGLSYLMTPGTLEEIQSNSDVQSRSWGVWSKFLVICLFSSAGFFGSSCSALITKEFGALTMSITSTARKAMTLFLSFALFNNVCTWEHISGIILFITALVAKSFRASRGSGSSNSSAARAINGKGHDDHDDRDNTQSNTLHYEVEGMEMSEPKKYDSGVKRRLRRRREDITVDIV